MKKRNIFKRIVVLFMYFYQCSPSYVTENVTLPGYQTTKSRSDLFCPEDLYCTREVEYCCACNALPCWKINASACGAKVSELFLEYTDPFGGAVLVDVNKGGNSVFFLNNVDGRLKKVPENICKFEDSLVEMNMSNNYIEDITGVRCLKMLDTLILDNNLITAIPDGLFSEMAHLRYLSLANNKLVNLQAFAIKIKHGNILNVDFSNNSFDKVDITNVLRPGEFCEVRFEGSEIEKQTNTEGYVLEKDKFHGPGKLNFASSSGQTWLNFSSLGVAHYWEFGSYMTVYMDFDNTSIHCDCNIVPFLRDLGKLAHKYWPNLENEFGIDFICEAPEQMKGISLTKMYKDADYDDLVCNLEDCPSGCKCTDKQNQNVVTVKCQDIQTFPDRVPVGFWGNYKTVLEMYGDTISQLPNRDYLSRVTSLNLRGTAISHFDPDAINALRDAKLYFPDRGVLHLPDTFYNLNPNNVDFGNNSVYCDCSNLWIAEWISNKSPSFALNCSTDRGTIRARSLTAKFLNCPEPETLLLKVVWALGAVVLALIMAIFVIVYFRYEIKVLKQRLAFKANKKVLEKNKFDVFLSFSEVNDEVHEWVREFLLRHLSKTGHSCFVPFRDIDFGNDRDLATGTAIKASRNLIVVLSDRYMDDYNSMFEFETIWKYVSKETNKQIIVINYDHFKSSEIADRRLKAVIRLRYDLNFKNRDTKFIDRLYRRLGRSCKESEKHRERDFLTIQDLETETLAPPEVHRSVRPTASKEHTATKSIAFSDAVIKNCNEGMVLNRSAFSENTRPRLAHARKVKPSMKDEEHNC